MKMKEILEKESTQLRSELADQQKHLFELRSQAVTEKLEDPSQLGKTKKVIARIMTVLRQRALQGQDQNGSGAATKEAGGESGAVKTAKPRTGRTRKATARVGKKTVTKKATARKAAAKAGTKARTKARAAAKKPAGEKPAGKKSSKKAKKKTAAAK